MLDFSFCQRGKKRYIRQEKNYFNFIENQGDEKYNGNILKV